MGTKNLLSKLFARLKKYIRKIYVQGIDTIVKSII